MWWWIHRVEVGLRCVCLMRMIMGGIVARRADVASTRYRGAKVDDCSMMRKFPTNVRHSLGIAPMCRDIQNRL